jgi:hypothetical protein
MTLFKNESIIRWTKIKKYIDSAPEQAFIIRKVGNDYIIYPDGNYSKQVKL